MVGSKTAAGRKIMKSLIFNHWTQLVFRLILGAVFLYAGFLKFQEPQRFADSIAGFQMLPDSLINLMGLSLPVFEMLAGIMLILGFQLRIAAFSVFILAGVFAAALVFALSRGLKIDCGCFGGGDPSTLKTWLSLGRDVLLGMMAWFVRTNCSVEKHPAC
jgi:uncharacterized membrane protein YphA (DoxX/SURF4 family)